MLVRLGIGNARPALSVGGSPFSTSSLKRRLEMLENRRLSNLSLRWRWSLAVLAAVLIPLQLVARTPEAPHISKPSVDVYQMLVGMWAQVQRPQTAESKPEKSATPGAFVTVKGTVTSTSPLDGSAAVELENAELQFEADGELFQVEAEKLKVEKLRAKIESALEQEKGIELKVAKLVEQAEQAGGIQEKADRARVEEMLAFVTKLREQNAQANADQMKLIEQLSRRAQELEVARAQEAARRVERQAREVTRAPQVTQQQRLERLLAQLEQLAAEQRRLLEEIRRVQQQSRE
jgi:hypothetical protein